MNIFITGASGFIGGNLLRKLLVAIGAHDRIFLLLRKECAFNDDRIVKLIGSLEEIQRYNYEISHCEYFFHLAANARFGDKDDYDKTNYRPVAMIVDVLRSSKRLMNFIFLSSMGAIDRPSFDSCRSPLSLVSPPHPASRYGSSKLKAEEYIRNGQIPFTIIRPVWVYGEGMRRDSHLNVFVEMAFKENPVFWLRFPGKVSLVHVDTLAQALVNCIGNKAVINKTYFAYTESLPMGEILRTIYESAHKRKIHQISVEWFSLVFSLAHRLFPLRFKSLFLDYLCVKDGCFERDFNISEAKVFVNSVDELIAANVMSGYWVITGANSGIGFALAKCLDASCKKAILIDKDISNLGEFKRHIVIKANLADLLELRDLARSVNKYKIFCLINNAGIGFKGSFSGMPEKLIGEVIDVDVKYPVFFTRFLLDNLIDNRSVIVNIASNTAYFPLPYMSLYAASKAFVLSWSNAISYELKETNKVITFSPSGTYTNFQKKAGVRVSGEGKGLFTADYVARKIIKAVYKKKKIIVLGFKAVFFSGISRLLPRQAAISLWGKLFETFR